jgi:hypothetical protein
MLKTDEHKEAENKKHNEIKIYGNKSLKQSIAETNNERH